MRVMHVQPQTLDLYGHEDAEIGNSVKYSLTNLAVAQARLGHSVEAHLLTTGKPSMRRVEKVTYRFHRCVQPPRKTLYARFARQFSLSILAAIGSIEPDIVHFHGVRALHLMYCAVAWWSGRCHVPLVAQERGYRDVGRIEGAAQTFALRRTLMVMAASKDSAEVIRGMGMAPGRVVVVPNGVDLTIFHPADVRPASSARPLRVLYVSRPVEFKDPMTMAQGLVELQRRGRAVELTMIGRGHMKDAVMTPLLAAGVPVHYEEHVPHGELACFYRKADVYVTTSLGEGWNQTILEAMASGLPVVHTDAPGIRDSAGHVGISIPVRSPAALADSLERLMDNPARRVEARERGLERARGFSWDEVARITCDLYATALASADRGAHGSRSSHTHPAQLTDKLS